MPDIERALLSKVIREGDFTPLIEHRITLDFFAIEANQTCFEFLQHYYEKYTDVPRFDTVENEIDWTGCRSPEPLQWYIDEIRQARMYTLVHGALADVKPLMAQRDVYGAKARLGEALMAAELEVNALRDVDLNSSWSQWWQDYKNRPEGLLGIPTGFPSIDYALSGYQPEQLTAIVGPQKGGKSTLALALATYANNYGLRPFFISFEMSAEEQRMRYYAMVAQIDYQKFLQRRLTVPEERRLERAMRSQELMPDFIMSTDITHGTTVAAVKSKIAQYDPDVIFIDGYYMMDSEVPDVPMMDTRALTALAANLKKMAQSLRKPVIITHQLLESRYSARRSIRSSDIGYTQALQMYCDNILGLGFVLDGDEMLMDQRELSIVLSRTAVPRRVRLAWDWSTSTFTEIEDYSEEHEDDFLGSGA